MAGVRTSTDERNNAHVAYISITKGSIRTVITTRVCVFDRLSPVSSAEAKSYWPQ